MKFLGPQKIRQTRPDNFSAVIKSPEVPGAQIDVKKKLFTPFTKMKSVAASQEPDGNHVWVFFLSALVSDFSEHYCILQFLTDLWVSWVKKLNPTFQFRQSGSWLSFGWIMYLTSLTDYCISCFSLFSGTTLFDLFCFEIIPHRKWVNEYKRMSCWDEITTCL